MKRRLGFSSRFQLVGRLAERVANLCLVFGMSAVDRLLVHQ